MAQIIKHRRGSLEGLAAVTSSINKGELVIATGSSNLSVSNGSSIVFAAAADGQLQAVNRILVGTSAPATFSNATYNGLVAGVPFYDSTSGSLYILGTDSNTKLNLLGNINSFSQSVDSRLDDIELSIGGGGSLGSRVSGLEAKTGSYATTGSNTFVSSQTISGDIFLSGTSRKIYNNDGSTNLIFGQYDGSAIYGPYYQLFGNNYAAADQRGTAEFVFDTRNGGGGFLVAGYDGTTWNRYFRVDRTGNTQVTGSLYVSGDISGSTLNGIGNVAAYSTSVDSRFVTLNNKNNTLQTYTASVDSTLARLKESTSSLNSYTASLKNAI